MKQIKLILTLTLLTFFTSCAPIYFYQSTRDRVQSTNKNNIENIQFFNDEGFSLVYKSQSKDESISGGKVKFQEGYYYYTIKFPKKTPAVAKHYNDEKLLVYFEPGKSLTFGKYKEDNDKYGLWGFNKTERAYGRDVKRFYVSYEGKDFRVYGNPRLIIKKNIDVDVKEDKRKAKGVKVN